MKHRIDSFSTIIFIVLVDIYNRLCEIQLSHKLLARDYYSFEEKKIEFNRYELTFISFLNFSISYVGSPPQ
jgi:hypothetical protein